MPPTNISARVMEGFNALGNGLVGNGPMPLPTFWKDLHMRSESYFNRLNITNCNQTLTFFQSSYSDYVTNLPQPGYIPGDHAMWLTSLAFTIQRGYQVDGTAEADGEPFQTDTDPSTVAADMQAIIENGLVELKIGSVIVARRFGLHHFPAGGGVNAAVSVANNTAAPTINHIAMTTNGAPSQQNKHRFTPPQSIFPNDQILLTVKWPFSRTLKDNYVIQADIEGGVVSAR